MPFVMPQLKPAYPFKPKPLTGRSRHARLSLLRARRSDPSISEIERAIGITPESSSDKKSSMMDSLASFLGQEGAVEKAVREASEKVAGLAEAKTAHGHRFVLNLCLKILPVWLLAVAIASGAIKLPFNIPFIDDLIM